MLKKLFLISVLIATCTATVHAADNKYANERTREIVSKMIEAHGGLQKWKNAPSVYFHHRRDVKAPQPEVRTSHVWVEQGRRRIHIDWPGENARLCWDGEKAWAVNWQRPFLPPRMMLPLGYYLFSLPWITHDPGVQLQENGMGKLPGSDRDYLVIKMTFAAGVGDTSGDEYLLHIDAETYRLKGAIYSVSYGALLDMIELPPEVKSIPNLAFVVDEFTTVDGLVVATAYTSYNSKGNVQATGKISNVSFRKPFDESLLEMPATAVIDESSPVRRSQISE